MWRALAISLAAHILLLWPGAVQRLPERAAGALHATLRPVEVTASSVEPVAVVPRPAQRAPLRAGKEVITAPAAVTPEAARATPSPAATETSTGASAERSAAVAAVPLPAPAGAVPGGGGGADADGLRQYRLALAREARRFKRYPQRALLAGIGGTVEVRVEHGAGAMPVTRLARSSGDESLDAAALGMVRQAAPRTAIPETLRGRAFAVTLPVIFDASEE